MKRYSIIIPLTIAVLLGFALAIGSTIGQGFISVGALAASAYATIQNAGVSVTQRTILNFVNGGCVDNAGATRTDCTISGGGAVTQIARTVLGSPAATVTFSSLGSFNHLQLVINGACSGAVVGDDVYLQANGDTGTNYEYQYVGALGTSPNNFFAVNTAQGDIGLVSCASAVTNSPGSINFTLLEYRGTMFIKNGNSTSGYVNNGTFGGSTPLFVSSFYWLWNSTSAITSLTLGMNGGSNFVTGSTFTLYGLN